MTRPFAGGEAAEVANVIFVLRLERELGKIDAMRNDGGRLKFGVGAYNETQYLRYTGQPDNWLEIGFRPGESGLHPTQKPVRLMETLIELACSPGQTVLDPFAGSNTTGRACEDERRRWIAIERNRDYLIGSQLRFESEDTPGSRGPSRKKQAGTKRVPQPLLFSE